MDKLIHHYEACKVILPTLNMELDYNKVTVTIGGHFIFSTIGPQCLSVAEAFFMGLEHGLKIKNPS